MTIDVHLSRTVDVPVLLETLEQHGLVGDIVEQCRVSVEGAVEQVSHALESCGLLRPVRLDETNYALTPPSS